MPLNLDDNIEKIAIQYITKGIIWVFLLGFPPNWFPPNWERSYVIDYLVEKLEQANEEKKQQLLQPLLDRCSDAYFLTSPIFPNGIPTMQSPTYKILFRYCDIYGGLLDVIYSSAWANKKLIIAFKNNEYLGNISLLTYPSPLKPSSRATIIDINDESGFQSDLHKRGLVRYKSSTMPLPYAKIATLWGINKSILETFPGCINTAKGIGITLLNTIVAVAKADHIRYLITWPLPEAVPKLTADPPKGAGFTLIYTNKWNVILPKLYMKLYNMLIKTNLGRIMLQTNIEFPLVFKELN